MSRKDLKSSLSLKHANEIIVQGLKVFVFVFVFFVCVCEPRPRCQEARRNNLAPIAICVLDVGGNLVAFAREDGCSLLREDIARGKAFGALGCGLSSRASLRNTNLCFVVF